MKRATETAPRFIISYNLRTGRLPGQQSHKHTITMRKSIFLLVATLLSITFAEAVAQSASSKQEATIVKAETAVKHLTVGKQMKIKKRDALIQKYKKIIEQENGQETAIIKQGIGLPVYLQDGQGNLYKFLSNRNITNYSNAYDIWKRAFCARADKPLDLYTDGIGIISASIIADTAHARYDRIKQLNEELMDIYELAVENMHCLNKQIDKAQNDTFTVARLRSQQLKHFLANCQMDTMFRSPIAANGNRFYKPVERSWYSYTEVDGVRDSIKWSYAVFHDDRMNAEIYRITRAIVASDDPDVDMVDIDKFAQAVFFKFRKDYESVGFDETKRIYAADKELAHSKAQSILASISPDEMIGTGSYARSKKDYYTEIYKKGICRRFIEIDSWDGSPIDILQLVANFKKRLESEGESVIDEILSNTALAANRNNTEAMRFYYEMLKVKNELEPTYERIVDIVSRAQRLELYGEVISYSKQMFAFPEFLDESNYQQARMYVRVVQSYEKLKGSTSQRYPYLQKAMFACPDYPEPYFYLANMIQGVNLGKQRAIVKRFIFCIAYDQFEIARQKLLELEAKGDETDVKSNLTVDIIQKAQARCKSYFPYRDDVFVEGPTIGMSDGKPFTLPLPFGKFTSVVRTQERTE